MDNIEKQGYVRLPSNYHSKSKLEYSDWTQAWFREAIQNEMDAGADKIDFTIQKHPDQPGIIQAICKGNGHGMDADRLFNGFLTMGGSKKSEGNIGGFGYAKVILAFAHDSYEIETQGIKLNGQGSEYTWTTGHPETTGVKLTANMGSDDVSTWQLEDALEGLINNSSLPDDVIITLNGTSLKPRKEVLPYKQATPLGNLSFKDMPDGHTSSTLWVRMNGLAMFEQRLYSRSDTSFKGYIELDGNSKDMLTSNRDGLNNKYKDVLSQIMDQLSSDREKLKLSGEIDLLLNESELSMDDIDHDTRQGIERAAKESGINVNDMLEMLKNAGDGDVNEMAKHPFLSLIKEVDKNKERIANRLDKIPADWYPENFRVKYMRQGESAEGNHENASEVSAKMNLKRYGKMAAGWEAIVSRLLESEAIQVTLGVRPVYGGNGYAYRDHLIKTGFIFGSPEGLCSRDKESKMISIMINPITADDDNFSVGDLIDVAIHELTHLNIDHHGESFTMKEASLRRIMRREIGERALINAFDNSLASWRDNHSEKVVSKAPKKKNSQKFTENSDFGM